MKNYDVISHVKGESQFVDDLLIPEGTLYASVFYSELAHGDLLSVDSSEAAIVEGVKGIFTAKDIPGENQIGGIVPDEELLAEDKVEFIGQPIAIVVADSLLNAREGAGKIKAEINPLKVITDPREAFANDNLIVPPRTFNLGDVENCWTHCDHIIEGKAESGGQEHLYLETQGAFAYPVEGGGIKIISSTQSPTAVQRVILHREQKKVAAKEIAEPAPC